MSTSKNVFSRSENSSRPESATLLTNSGMGIMMILIILAVTAIGMMGLMSIGSIQRRSQSQATVPAQVVMIRGNIMNILKNQASWNNTANDPANTTLNCYRTNAPCVGPLNSPVTNMPITEILNAKDSNGSPSYHGNDLTWSSHQGFAADGTPCTNFPTEQCPISFQALWSCAPSPSGTTTGCDSASSYSNLQVMVIPRYKPIRPSTGQLSPDAVILNETKYTAGPVLRTTTSTFYNYP